MENLDLVLNSNYIKPDRPYSQTELNEKRKQIFYKLKIGQCIAHHDCGHVYHCKKFGKKEKMIESNNAENLEEDFGNCSVCWKISKIHPNLIDISKDISSEYADFLKKPDPYLSHYMVELEQVFYTWLYRE